ncbi:hypothetical protein JOF29_007321 [Kribbella aluminosa]|uniref:Uncharacterized protein n=1 Tax=Kribbella aluminosa TaxID=416017 RepID=A0ABS4UX54_9ACTN|nr:hypothetical protein [Kribbella aluminosa]MBP2356211.1 hypothetical protein [Kribbella aluminosa]
MPAINWNTVATSAATAIIVTLAIEYLAKPRLEARKERILGVIRTRQEVLAVITKLSIVAKMYGDDLPATAPLDLQRRVKVERDRLYKVLEDQSRHLMDDVARYAGVYRGPLRDILIEYTGAVHGVMLSMRPRQRKAAHLAQLGKPIATAPEVPPRWQVRALVRMVLALRQVQHMVATIEDEIPAATPAELARRR